MTCKIIRTSRGTRKVRVLANGQYRFMKMTKRKARRARRTVRHVRKHTRRRSHKKTRKSKKYSGGGLFG